MGKTIKDIAEYAGVSTMTVSRVINNSGYVSVKTRAVVEAAVNDLNYQPNLLARGLINRKSSLIYVIVPDISNPFYADMTKGIESVARQHDYSIILSSAYWKEELEEEYLDVARGRMAEGVILVLPRLTEKQLVNYSHKFPLVVVDRFIESEEVDAIYVNQEDGVSKGVNYLISLGHKRIAYLSGPEHIYNNYSRQKGYQHALHENGIEVDSSLFFKGDFSYESGIDAFREMLKLSPDLRPSAIFAASDMMALGFIQEAVKNNYRIPDDISIVGFDDIYLASVTIPPLTTVRHPYKKMGQNAMRHLLLKLNTNSVIEDMNQLENTLMIRGTATSYNH